MDRMAAPKTFNCCTEFEPAGPLASPGQPVATPPVTGSRRRRLWELARQCHCQVVGVCLPSQTLRRLANKALGRTTLADDYELHVGAVAECGGRNPLSELFQRELEQRYARQVRDFRQAKSTDGLARLWKKTFEQGDVAGALWAALTHPRCDATLQEVMYRNMHMFAHHAGACVHSDNSELTALLEENAVLARELGRVQQRSNRLHAEKSADMARLNAQLVQVCAAHIAKDSHIAYLCDALAALKASLPEFDTRLRLQQKVGQLTTRQSALEAQNADLRQQLASVTKLPEVHKEEAARTAGTDRAEAAAPSVVPVTVFLNRQSVLCVGGRSGSVASYRALIEQVGGRFSHHDGGLEDNPNVLDASLGAADLVICQTGCISHNAYWKVKDFCKRSGKRCVFVENPSTSSLARGLAQMSGPGA